MISKIKDGLKSFLKHYQNMIIHTLDFKGKTALRDAFYALIFQFVIIMITFIFLLGMMITIISHILFYIFLGYVVLTMVSTLSLATRRLRDAGINPFQLLYLPFSYLLLGLMTIFLFNDEYQSVVVMLMLIIFFLSHFYMIIIMLLPTEQNPQD